MATSLDIKYFMKGLVYELIDPTTHKTFYVGSTENIYGRITSHMLDGKANHDSRKAKHIATLLRRNMMFGVNILEVVYDATVENKKVQLLDQERYWISKRSKQGHELTNETPWHVEDGWNKAAKKEEAKILKKAPREKMLKAASALRVQNMTFGQIAREFEKTSGVYLNPEAIRAYCIRHKIGY